GGAEIRQRLEPLGGGEGVARRAHQALTQRGCRRIIVEVLRRAHSRREQVGGGLGRARGAPGHEREHGDHERRDQTANHGASSRNTMSVITSCWPDAISKVRSYGWKPSRSTRSKCVPGQTGRSLSGTVPSSCPSTYTLPQGKALTDRRPSSMRCAPAGGGAGRLSPGGGGGGAVCVTRGAAARWGAGARGRAAGGLGVAGAAGGGGGPPGIGGAG